MWSLLVHPQEDGTTSKTGERDLSLLMDSAWLQWMGPVYKAMRTGKGGDRLFEFGYGQFLLKFRAVVATLGKPAVVPYQIRHSGASGDRADDSRTPYEIQSRGRWRAMSSVERYEKAARLAIEAHGYPKELVEHIGKCEEAIEGVLGRNHEPPLAAGTMGTGRSKASKESTSRRRSRAVVACRGK